MKKPKLVQEVSVLIIDPAVATKTHVTSCDI